MEKTMRMHETSSAKWSNTITYPDDVKFQTWSVLPQHCRFRLQAMRDLLNLEGATWLDKTLPNGRDIATCSKTR